MDTSSAKICPECGASNDSNDLFCRDCGTSMAMVTSAVGQTTSFTPVSPALETQTTAVAPAIAPTPSVAQPVIQTSAPQAYGTLPHEESARGAVLGWLAATLMLIIVAAFVWSSLISDAARDRIIGIF